MRRPHVRQAAGHTGEMGKTAFLHTFNLVHEDAPPSTLGKAHSTRISHCPLSIKTHVTCFKDNTETTEMESSAYNYLIKMNMLQHGGF